MKDVFLSVICNGIALCSSLVFVFVLPKFIDVEGYGYWQLFMFCFSYIGIFHCGISDGIFIRYLGKKIDYVRDSSAGLEILISTGIATVFAALVSFICFKIDFNRDILLAIICLVPFVHFNLGIEFILQATFNIKLSAKIRIWQNTLLLILLSICLMTKIISTQICMVIFALSHIFATIWFYSVYVKKIKNTYHTNVACLINNIKIDFATGIKLLIANVSSTLILGVLRFSIIQIWTIAQFGMMSLVISLCNFMITFINAISIVILPKIRNMTILERRTSFYNAKIIIGTLCCFCVLFVYPVSFFIEYWLPQYNGVISYLYIMFPVFFFECRVSLLINSFLKSIGKESALLQGNLVSVFVAIVFAISIKYFNSLTLAAVSILLSLAFRGCFLEYLLNKALNVEFGKINLILTAFVLAFSLLSLFVPQDYKLFLSIIIILPLVCVFPSFMKSINDFLLVLKTTKK